MRNKDIEFRRIKGRIVPIKKKQTKDYSKIMRKSAGYEFATAGGVALAGHGAARFMRHNALQKIIVAERGMKIKERALKAGNLKIALKASDFVKRATKGSMGATKIATGLRMGTFALTSALLGAGIQSVVASRIKEPSEKTEFALTLGSGIAGIAATMVAGRFGLRGKAAKAYQIIKKTIKR